MKTSIICVLALLASCMAQIDQTLIANSKGLHVVKAVVAIIQQPCIFEDDKLFLRRLAYVETHDGEDADTYRAGYNGGIWQISSAKYDLTKQVSSVILNQVQTSFGINWASTTWTDLLKPLHSGLAARLYLQYKKESASLLIPNSEADQAAFWSSQITSSGGPASEFTTSLASYVSDCVMIADIAFLVDGSGSISRREYNQLKDFLKSFVPKLNIGSSATLNTRVAITVFSDKVYPQFDLNAYTTAADVISRIDTLSHPQMFTATNLGLDYIRNQIFLASNGDRPDISNIVVVLTDGVSGNTGATLASAQALLATPVEVFAVGIGNRLSVPELEAIASNPDCNYLTILSDFTQFNAFVEQLEKRVCAVPTNLIDGTAVVLNNNGIKYFYYQLNPPCKILKISAVGGSANIYYATSYHPNPAKYDGTFVLAAGETKRVFSTQTSGTVFLTVVGSSSVTVNFDFLDDACGCPSGMVESSFAVTFTQCIPAPPPVVNEGIDEGIDNLVNEGIGEGIDNLVNGYNCGPLNPCFPSVLVPNKFHYPHTTPTMFVQCSEWGECWERPCAPPLVWQDVLTRCDWP